MTEKNISFQKDENDCWICALRNMLVLLGRKLSKEQILDIIINRKGLALLAGRGFFPYLPEVLDFLRLSCDFVLDSDDLLLSHIFSEKPVIHMDRLDIIEQRLYHEKDALYYFYKSLKSVIRSPYVNVKFDTPVIREYLDKGYIVTAGLRVSELYGIRNSQTLHTVTVTKEDGELKIIDPYEALGRSEEKNWSLYEKFMYQRDWTSKAPYFIAAKKED